MQVAPPNTKLTIVGRFEVDLCDKHAKEPMSDDLLAEAMRCANIDMLMMASHREVCRVSDFRALKLTSRVI